MTYPNIADITDTAATKLSMMTSPNMASDTTSSLMIHLHGRGQLKNMHGVIAATTNIVATRWFVLTVSTWAFAYSSLYSRLPGVAKFS